MSMCYDFEKWTIVTLGLIAAVLTTGLIAIVYADDTEDKGTPTLIDQLLERAREWNIQTAINETLQTAERFNDTK